MSPFVPDNSLWQTASRTEMEESYRNHLTKVRHVFFPLTCTRYQSYLTNPRQRSNQGPLSELERNVTLPGKNVVTIPKLTTSQSMKKEAHFQH